MNHVRQQILNLRITLASIISATGLVFGSLIIVWLLTDIPPGPFTRDPLGIEEAAFYIGAVSNLGIILWAVGAGVSGFTAWVLRRDGGRKQRIFALSSSVTTFYLLLDDLYMVHEQVGPVYLGISEKVIYASIAAVLLGWTVINREVILRSEYVLVLMAFFGWGMTVVMDLTLLEKFYPAEAHTFLEDGFKFLAILSWMIYLLRTNGAWLRHVPRGEAEAATSL